MSRPAAIAWRTAALLALLALLVATPGLVDRALPLDCALPQGTLHCDAAPCTLNCNSTASWRDYPYLTLEARTNGEALLRWSATQAIELVPGSPADIGARWDGPIGSAQLILSAGWRLYAITLHTRLRPVERLQLALRELLAPEPYVASSNNTTPPRWVLQSSLIAWVGLASLLAMLALLLPRAEAAAEGAGRSWLFAVLLTGFLLVSGGPLASLAAHAAQATEHSALQPSLRAEEAARYGEPFAQLADELRAHVPRGALVLFPRDLEHADESEAHWTDFHFWPGWRSVPQDGSTPAYVFWYRPLLLRRTGNEIVDQGGKVLLRTEPVSVLDDGRAILRVLP